MNHLQELVGDPRDRDVGDVDLLLAHQVQQQIERAGESLEVDDEPGGRQARLCGGGQRGGHHWKMFQPVPTAKGSARSIRCVSAHRAG